MKAAIGFFRFYLFQILLVFDQVLNVVVCLGYADETMSSNAWRMWRDNKPWGRLWKPVIDWLFFWQKDHCYNGYLAELKRKQLPPEFR